MIFDFSIPPNSQKLNPWHQLIEIGDPKDIEDILKDFEDNRYQNHKIIKHHRKYMIFDFYEKRSERLLDTPEHVFGL